MWGVTRGICSTTLTAVCTTRHQHPSMELRAVKSHPRLSYELWNPPLVVEWYELWQPSLVMTDCTNLPHTPPLYPSSDIRPRLSYKLWQPSPVMAVNGMHRLTTYSLTRPWSWNANSPQTLSPVPGQGMPTHHILLLCGHPSRQWVLQLWQAGHGRQVVGQAVVGNVCPWVTDGAQLPVQHSLHGEALQARDKSHTQDESQAR